MKARRRTKSHSKTQYVLYIRQKNYTGKFAQQNFIRYWAHYLNYSKETQGFLLVVSVPLTSLYPLELWLNHQRGQKRICSPKHRLHAIHADTHFFAGFERVINEIINKSRVKNQNKIGVIFCGRPLSGAKGRKAVFVFKPVLIEIYDHLTWYVLFPISEGRYSGLQMAS